MKADSQDATSQVTATLLMVALTVILAALILLCFHLPDMDWEYTEPPVIFRIEQITSPQPTFESLIYLRNVVEKDYPNRELSAKIYSNDELLPCTILTLNTHDFISTAHYGVSTLSREGGNGDFWHYNQLLRIDISNGYIHPGDEVRVDIIETESGTVISRDAIEA